MRTRALGSSSARVLAAIALALGAGAPAALASPVLHEFIKPDAAEDLALSATTAAGRLPAALDTPSGIVPAPDVEKSPFSGQTTYGGSSTPNSPDATYRIDRNTTQPDLVRYDDPFVPSITPFKRLHAFDAVDEQLELVVWSKSLMALASSGRAPQAGEDAFFADIVVDLIENTPVRVPSVGPGSRVVSAVLHPPTRFELLRDSAENWYVRASERKRARLIFQLAVPRAAFGSSFADVGWATLREHLHPLPLSARPTARRVLQRIGVTSAMRPKAALAALVDYFRSFNPSADLPAATAGLSLYEELSLGKKGVCRHRAYAFMLTALEAGLPARFVHNEAHAWVEVFDGELWHRIDLGGAAQNLELTEPSEAPRHEPPEDPYAWPEGSQSGRELAQTAGNGSSGSGTSSSNRPSGDGTSDPTSPPATPPADPSSDPTAPGSAMTSEPTASDPAQPSAQIRLALPRPETRRGEALAVSGSVLTPDGEPCAYVRVDLALRTAQGTLIPMQPLPTRADGSFDGHVVVPIQGVDVGEYDVVATTPGNAHCGAGRGE